MTNYAKGARYERALMKAFQGKGYFVMRAAGSHSAADLSVFGRNSVRLVQVKSSRRTVAKVATVRRMFGADVKKLAEIKRAVPFVDVELWLWTFRRGWRVFAIYSQGNVEEIKCQE